MVTKADWIMASVGKSWYALRYSCDGPRSARVYDPKGISHIAAYFHIKTPLTEERARAMVDRLNGPRGELHRVRGTFAD